MRVARYISIIKDYIEKSYKKCLREPYGKLKYPFVVPGAVYSNCLWDWDSWLTGIALVSISEKDTLQYNIGCVLNFLNLIDDEGKIPICAKPDIQNVFIDFKNIHKPCLAQHALFVSEREGNVEWIREYIGKLEKYIKYYETECKHSSGLYLFIDDCAIGVDNDPCAFFRPDRSSATTFLNFLMYAELNAVSKIEGLLERKDKEIYYIELAEELKNAINKECWDEKDGFFYSADLNVLPIDQTKHLHSGYPRHWDTLPMKIRVWSGFMALWCGLADREQAKRIVLENYDDVKTFNAKYGIRSLAKTEKMYKIVASSNPSCWLGPVWVIVNYMVFKGLFNYGYKERAKELAEKTITLLGKDIEICGEMHEYYDGDTGKGIINQGFQSWNLLVYDMIKTYENKSL